jgi:hypothetical protein
VFDPGSNLKKASAARKMASGYSKLVIRYEGIAGGRPISDSRHIASPPKLLSYGFGMFKRDNRTLEFTEISAHCPQSL